MMNTAKIEEQFKNIYTIIGKMSPGEREVLSDKLLAWLLFQPTKDNSIEKTKEAKKSNSRKRTNPISKKDQELLKKIADKTDELYKKLGGDTI